MKARNSLCVALAALAMGANCRNVDLPEEVRFVSSAEASGAGIHVNPASGLTTTEAGGTATFAVSLVTKPTANVTVTLTSNNTGEGQIKQTAGACATGGTAGTGSCTLTFTDTTWLNPQSVQVVGKNDDYIDGNITYTIDLVAASADSDYNGKTATANLTNNDNDTAGFTATPASGLVTKTGGVTATTQLKLSSQPTANVTFSVMSDNTGAGDVTTPASKSFTFTNANWNTNQALTITGAATLATYKIVINGTVASTDPKYSGITGTVLHTGIGATNIAAGDRFIFYTSTASNGNLGGVAGADAKCNAAPNKPNSSTYKAIIGGGGRTACTTANCSGGPTEHDDWVLYPNQKYVRTGDALEIATTTANGIFTFPLVNAISDSSSSPWTGIKQDWTTSSSTCTNWNWTSGNGLAGSSIQKSASAIDAGYGGGFGLSCNVMYPIYCAEQ